MKLWCKLGAPVLTCRTSSDLQEVLKVCFLSAGVLREVTTHFTVDARAHHKSGGGQINACISNPSGTNTDAYITDKGDGTYRVEYTPYEDGEAFNTVTGSERIWPDEQALQLFYRPPVY